ncbi:exopolysaccharide biosynthesis polyprenyl glycosylphosphotransferase [Streptomyces sp. TRM 70361]|uniref:exopolysaccharide biosynthesis polyprenyl glycosylphosphotransferase n=1 Tax=Streptomyces sp. TRM 70361 TaxID=3116553 RepID=UPI002E7C5300|nr:exopolysaccharide biosynthesis polyprenyl glycosylphosphotransferase [Streptomyces sp. TRM 70361]MEE1942952.1 exopolysaccharide biosynthesis polyprenyl glycosylphosphotransferase [Streptomyces sp. TRM 70361]
MTAENTGTSHPNQVLTPPPSTVRPAVPAPPRRGPFPRRMPPRPRRLRRGPRTAAPLVAADCLAAVAAVTVITAATAAPGSPGAAVLWAVLPATAVPLNAHGGLYRTAPAAVALDELPALFGRAALAWCVAAALLAATAPGRALGWTALAVAVAAHTVLACAARGTVRLALRRAGRRRPRSTLVVGTGRTARRITAALHAHPEYGMRPVGLADPGGEPGADSLPDPFPEPDTGPDAEPGGDIPVPVLTGQEDIVRAAVQNAVRDVVLTQDPRSDPAAAELVPLLAALDCTVWLAGPSAPHTAGRLRGGDHLWGFACRRLDPPPRHRTGTPRRKRALDVVVAATALVALAPLLLACALAVRIADGPGVLFRQERVGLAGRPITVLKFRTLRPRDEHESATRWSVADDRRMSPVGRALRRTSLDELPQLWNVLRGDMSLVGPRPERPYFVQRFSRLHPGYAARHRMPAGITGLAQVHGLRGDTSIEDRARFDNHYIDTWSLWQDIGLLLRTAGSVLRLGGR